MHDLGIMHLTSRAIIDEVIELGVPKTTRQFLMTDPRAASDWLAGPSPTFPLNVPFIEESTLAVRVDGESLEAGGFSLESISGNLFVVLSGPAPIQKAVVDFSTPGQFLEVEFEARGTLLAKTTRVLLGQSEEVSSFKIINDERMRFTIPKSVVPVLTSGGDITTGLQTRIENRVVAVSFTDGVGQGSGPIVVDLSTRARSATGVQLLIQRFLVLLLDRQGGNLEGIMPKSVAVGPQLSSQIISRASLAVGLAQAKMKSTTPSNAKPEEILESATVTGITFPNNSEAQVSIKLVSKAGAVSTVPLSVRS